MVTEEQPSRPHQARPETDPNGETKGESDVAHTTGTSNVKRKNDVDRLTELRDKSPKLFKFMNRSTSLRKILMEWFEEEKADATTKEIAPQA